MTRRFINALAVLLVVLLPSAFVLAMDATRDPLEKLEHRTRQIPSLHAVYVGPTDDVFAYQVVRLRGIVESVLGVEVVFQEIPADGVFGYTNIAPERPRVVFIESRLHWTARLEVLAHEAAHRLQPPVLSPTSESEVFAEAVSFLVCRKLGHDSLETAANYLALHKGGLHVLTDYRMEIDYAVAVLTAGV